MAGGSGSGGASSGGGSVNKTALLLFGAGLTAIIAIMGPRILPDDEAEPEPEPAPSVSVVAGGGEKPVSSVTAAQPTRAQSSAPVRPIPDDLRSDPNDAVLTIVAYGLPARISATARDPAISLRQRVREFCSPDIYPEPCITDYVAKKGTVLTITAGDSRAGPWPVLDYVTGGGCNLKGNGDDLKCEITLTGDIQVEAWYYGEVSGAPAFQFPKCPPDKGSNPPAWVSRCQ